MTNLTPEVMVGILTSIKEEIANDEEYDAAIAYIRITEERIITLTCDLMKKNREDEARIDERGKRYREVTNKLRSALYRQRAICEQYLMDKGLEEPAPETKYTWSAEVFDLKDLVGAAAINPEYLEFLLPNQTKLNALARKNKSTMRVPGVVAVRKEKS